MYMSFKTFEKLKDHPELIHGFTYKNGGIAELPFGNQHMGILSCHYREQAWQNVKHLIENLSLEREVKALVCTEQVHSNHLVNFDPVKQTPNSESEFLKDELPVYVQPKTDGVFTNKKGYLLMTFYADCTPVYFYDPKKQACGMVHSGWKGTALKIAVSGAQFMVSQFGSNLVDLIVVIGPSAGKCCYEVDPTVFSEFPNHLDCFEDTRPGHYRMDMKAIIQKDLLGIGLLENQIEISADCTLCQPELYFSHRREKGNTGRMAAFMML